MFVIRLAKEEDVAFLSEIEEAAGDMFSQFPFTADLPGDLTPLDEFLEAQRKNLLWVAALASGKPIGFALVKMIEGQAHLEEVDVHPAYGRQGIGTRLVQSVIEWVRSSGISAVTLTTFRDIPWNEPFYRKLGFRVLEWDELSAGLVEVVEEEERHGLDRELRVVMRMETMAS